MAVKRKRPSEPNAETSGSKEDGAKKMKAPKMPTKLGDFIILPLQLPPVANLPSATHYLYLRAHSGSSSSSSSSGGAGASGGKSGEELPKGRTLFVVNLPVDAGVREVRELFGRWGVVERVVLRGEQQAGSEDSLFEEEDDQGEAAKHADHEMDADSDESDEDESDAEPSTSKRRKRSKRPTNTAPPIPPLPDLPPGPHPTARSAHVIYLDPTSLSLALKPHPSPVPIYTRPTLGLQYYISLHSALRPPLEVVKAHADAWMERWELEREAGKQKSKYRMGEAEVDEDGFTLVKRGGKYGRALGGVVGVASREFELAHKPRLSTITGAAGAVPEEAENRKGRGRKKKARRAAGEVPDFYRFQVREKKRKEFVELREKFEEDKKRVQKLREERRFRPY